MKRFVVALTVVSLLSSCSAPPQYLLLTQNPGSVTLLAQVEGRVAIVAGTCWGLDTDSGLVLTIFPAGTRADGDALDIPGADKPFHIGDLVTGSGGGSGVQGNAGFYSPIDVPDACLANGALRLDAVG